MHDSCCVVGVGHSQRKDPEEGVHCWVSEECSPMGKDRPIINNCDISRNSPLIAFLFIIDYKIGMYPTALLNNTLCRWST